MVIQRSWKILSDASTSASSTEANRSPVLQSSSDDSNCSNQTTHSMVTSASPNSPAAVESNIVDVPPFNAKTEPSVKFVTTPEMAETMLQRLKQRLGGPYPNSGISGSNSESAMHSLELLRMCVQAAFDKEIDTIVKRFVEDYFKPAFNNIKENLGQHAISEDTLLKMACVLLENAKDQYNTFRTKAHSGTQPLAAATTTTNNIMRMALKRPAMKSADTSEIQKKIFSSSTQQQQNIVIPSSGGAVKTTTPTAAAVPQTATLHHQKPQAGGAAAAPARRQIFWNTAHISTTTKFVLDVQANQAFGFGTDGKERLASKHPELIRYLPDSEDRDWLITQNIISPQNRNSRFLFLIYDEVIRLQQTFEVYRLKSSIDLSIMHTFVVPEFIIQKMKLFFVDLNIKSRGLITNSFSVSATQGNSHLRNALLQGVQNTTTTTSTTTTTISASSSISTSSVTTTATSSSSVGTTVFAVVANDASAVGSSNNVSSAKATSSSSSSTLVATASTDSAQTRFHKSSTLSSSHATLASLLNNSQQNLMSPQTGMDEKLSTFSQLKQRK